MPSCEGVADGSVRAFLLRRAAAPQVEDYWRERVIPTVHYSLDRSRVWCGGTAR
jgi:hypothetical protein